MFYRQSAGNSHNKKVANKVFENEARFKCLQITVTDQNYIHEEVKRLIPFSSEYFVLTSPT
jgi:hypothetical protein